MNAPQSLKEYDWADLLNRLHNQDVLPIVGPELVTCSLPSGGPAVPLNRALAPRLAAALGLDQEMEPSDSLDRVASRYLLQAGRGEHDKIYKVIRSLLDDLHKEGQPPAPALCDLASITDFHLFIAATFDDFLTTTLGKVRQGFRGSNGPQVLAFDPRRPVDLPKSIGPSLVYQLLGSPKSYPKFAVTDDDQLEFIHMLAQHTAKLPNLFDQLRSRSLLFLGVPFSYSVLQLFLLTAKGPGRDRDSRHEVYLVDGHKNLHERLGSSIAQVLESIDVIAEDPSAFASELAHRWQAKYGRPADAVPVEGGSMSSPEAMPKDAIFVSYAREDFDAVRRLVDALGDAGLPVWFDRQRLHRLNLGADYPSEIKRAVQNDCSFFISVISTTTEGTPEAYFHGERHWAAERMEDLAPGEVFYLPVIIDETITHPIREPSILKSVQYDRLPGGRVTQPFIRRLQQLLAESRYRQTDQPRSGPAPDTTLRPDSGRPREGTIDRDVGRAKRPEQDSQGASAGNAEIGKEAKPALRDGPGIAPISSETTPPETKAPPAITKIPEELRELIRSPTRMARLLARLALQDRARLALLESPDSTGVLDALRAWSPGGPTDLLAFERSMEEKTGAFEPNPLWVAWMTQVHGDRLRQMADALTKPVHEPPGSPEQAPSDHRKPSRQKTGKKERPAGPTP